VNTKLIIQYFATMAAISEPKKKLVSVHKTMKGELASSTETWNLFRDQYGEYRGGKNHKTISKTVVITFLIL
jgi:hypothetical protein